MPDVMTVPVVRQSSGAARTHGRGFRVATDPEAAEPVEPAVLRRHQVAEATCGLCGRLIAELEKRDGQRVTVFRTNTVGPWSVLIDIKGLRCGVCGGFALVGEIEERVERIEPPLSMGDGRPLRGRPPNWLVKERAKALAALSGAHSELAN